MKKADIKNFTALVTGADSGIGLAITNCLAQRGCSPIVMVSNQKERLEQASTEIFRRYGTVVETIEADLSAANSGRKLYEQCRQRGIEPDILVNNAGIFYFHQTVMHPLDEAQIMNRLHMETPTETSLLFGRDMCTRGRGYIMNLSSICAWMPNPGLTMYAATKGYVRLFTLSLDYELRDYGVSATTVCPGGVATGLYNFPPRLVGFLVAVGIFSTPQRLARRAVRAMLGRRRQLIPGFVNRLAIVVVSNLPRGLRMRVKRKIFAAQDQQQSDQQQRADSKRVD